MEQLLAFAWLGLALVVGKLIRKRLAFLRNMFIPASIIGGFFLLLLGPEVLQRVTRDAFTLISTDTLRIWSGYPGFLINIVFACLFLGKTIPGIKDVWAKAGPQVALSHTIAWGQYVVGLAVTALILIPLFDVEPMFGALIEIGFIGGHGTAAGLGDTFRELGWPEGQDLALGVATIGLIAGVLSGIVIINWGVKKGHTRILTNARQEQEQIEILSNEIVTMEDDLLLETQKEDTPAQTHKKDAKNIIKIESMEPLSFHLAYIGLAIGVGAIILTALKWIEKTLLMPLGMPELFGHVPLFPLAMIGGIVVEKLHHKFFDGHLDRKLILKVQGGALDLLIVSALGSLTLSAIADAWMPLAILIITGMLWTIGVFIFLAPRMLSDYWFERGMGDFGQSLGVTATGLLLMRITDPKAETPAFEAFGYKQLLFEPLVGGGLFTAVSAPLVHTFGLTTMLVVTSIITLFWLCLGLYLKKKTTNAAA